jgi:hypothetical protein
MTQFRDPGGNRNADGIGIAFPFTESTRKPEFSGDKPDMSRDSPQPAVVDCEVQSI